MGRRKNQGAKRRRRRTKEEGTRRRCGRSPDEESADSCVGPLLSLSSLSLFAGAACSGKSIYTEVRGIMSQGTIEGSLEDNDHFTADPKVIVLYSRGSCRLCLYNMTTANVKFQCAAAGSQDSAAVAPRTAARKEVGTSFRGGTPYYSAMYVAYYSPHPTLLSPVQSSGFPCP